MIVTRPMKKKSIIVVIEKLMDFKYLNGVLNKGNELVWKQCKEKNDENVKFNLCKHLGKFTKLGKFPNFGWGAEIWLCSEI
jgi:hypothetical protein